MHTAELILFSLMYSRTSTYYTPHLRAYIFSLIRRVKSYAKCLTKLTRIFAVCTYGFGDPLPDHPYAL